MSQIKELIVDAYGCESELSSPEALERAARAVLEAEGATVVKSIHHQFQPHGLTLCLILKESHFVVSTWPEFKMAIVNIFLCNESMSTMRVWTEFAKALKPKQTQIHEVKHWVGEVAHKKTA